MMSFIDYAIFTLEESDGFGHTDCGSFKGHSLMIGEWGVACFGESSVLRTLEEMENLSILLSAKRLHLELPRPLRAS